MKKCYCGQDFCGKSRGSGERGSEAVLPLDDFTMDRLGMAIARHMSINNDNKIYLNARQIARQMNITNKKKLKCLFGASIVEAIVGRMKITHSYIICN